MKPVQEQQRTAEEELQDLRAENERLSAFFGHASDAFIVLDEERRIVSMNESAVRMTGFGQGEGLHCGDLFRCHDDQGTELRDQLCFGKCSLQKKQSAPYEEMFLKHRDGHSFPVSVSYSYIPLSNGAVNLLMVMRDLTVKKRLEQEMLAKNELEITLKERERLSRDLHDGLVQSLAFLGLKSKMALTHLDNGQYDRAGKSLTEIKDVIQESYGEVRQALYDLRTPATEDLVGYLREYMQNFSLQTKLQTRVEADEAFPRCDNPRTAIHVLKVVQEAVTNVRKHAEASSVTIEMRAGGREAEIRVIDDGRGFDVSQPSDDGMVHYGLTTMSERMQLIGGRVAVASAVGEGTTISFLLPEELFRG